MTIISKIIILFTTQFLPSTLPMTSPILWTLLTLIIVFAGTLLLLLVACVAYLTLPTSIRLARVRPPIGRTIMVSPFRRSLVPAPLMFPPTQWIVRGSAKTRSIMEILKNKRSRIITFLLSYEVTYVISVLFVN